MEFFILFIALCIAISFAGQINETRLQLKDLKERLSASEATISNLKYDLEVAREELYSQNQKYFE